MVSREVPSAFVEPLSSGNWRMRVTPAEGFLLGPPKPEPRQGEVQWYVPYTQVHPKTVEGAPSDAIWIDVGAGPDAYYWALREIWARGESFALLEHDVVCRPDVIEAFEADPALWITCPYDTYCHSECREAWRNQLGCTRFRAELIEAVPDAMMFTEPELRVWTNVCDGLGRSLRNAGFTHQWFFPEVRHHQMNRHDQ